jgi:hypothetical protein
MADAPAGSAAPATTAPSPTAEIVPIEVDQVRRPYILEHAVTDLVPPWLGHGR